MAFIRKMRRSPYWYLVQRGFDGKWRAASTGFRCDSPADTNKAKRLAQRKTLNEQKGWANITRGARFSAWVPTYLASRYRSRSEESLRRTEIAWSTINGFLIPAGVQFPRQVEYGHAQQFLAWRTSKKIRGRIAGHNTARMELKFFSLIMDEAVRRDFADNNPFKGLVIPIAAQRRKKSLSDEEIAKIRVALRDEAPWMRIVFEIMLWTGCRFNESSIAVVNLDFAGNSITLVDSKREHTDQRKYFTVPMPPDLRPMLEEIVSSGASKTVELTREKNWRFNRFLKAHCGATSHSLRVTFITRCHQSGMNERQAMRLVNHSSKPVHDVYSRLSVEDVRDAQARIAIPPANVSVRPTSPAPT